MSIGIKNGSTMTGRDTTLPYDSTRRVVYQGIEYVIGPNMIVNFADNGTAAAIDAYLGSNETLRRTDSRDKDGSNTAT